MSIVMKWRIYGDVSSFLACSMMGLKFSMFSAPLRYSSMSCPAATLSNMSLITSLYFFTISSCMPIERRAAMF